ncbi:hypothetical protein Tco_0312564 [Tanacetum coccineum]
MALMVADQMLTAEIVGEVKATADTYQRKAEMAKHSDAFIALPDLFSEHRLQFTNNKNFRVFLKSKCLILALTCQAMKLILDIICDQESRGEGASESQKKEQETPTDTKKQPTPAAKAKATGTQLTKTERQGQSTKRQQFDDPSTERKKKKED